MEIILEKQPKKYLDKSDDSTRRKIYKALDNISRLNGNIRPLSGREGIYRYKMDHYRVVFEWKKGNTFIRVIEINTRTNISY